MFNLLLNYFIFSSNLIRFLFYYTINTPNLPKTRNLSPTPTTINPSHPQLPLHIPHPITTILHHSSYFFIIPFSPIYSYHQNYNQFAHFFTSRNLLYINFKILGLSNSSFHKAKKTKMIM